MITAEPAATPVTGEDPELPAEILTVGGWMSTTPLGDAANEMLTPPGGAGCDRVTVPVTALDTPTVLTVSAMSSVTAVVTVTATEAFVDPVTAAKMNAVPKLNNETVTSTEVALAGIIAFAGTVMTDELLLIRFTVKPPGPAGLLNFTVRTRDEFGAMASGSGANVRLFKPDVMVAVAGLLSAKPSFTISCAT